MANADGSVVIVAEFDSKKAITELNRLNQKIQNIEDKIYTKKQQQMPLLEQSKRLVEELGAARRELYEMQHPVSGMFFSDTQIKQQEQLVKRLQKEWTTIHKKIESYNDAIQKANVELDLQKERAVELQEQIADSQKGSISDVLDGASEKMDKLSNRILNLAKSALVFSVITAGLGKLRDYIGEIILRNDQATAAIARLKGALLTLAQPILDIVIPAFVSLLNILTQVVSVAAQIIALLFGKTIGESKAAAKSLNAEKKALSGVGSAAEDAAGSLAGFDEINQITTERAGGGGAETGIAPDFGFESVMDESWLNGILDILKAIGLALLAWKLSDSFLGGLRTFAGLLIAIKGAEELARAVWDAWVNGVSFQNFMDILLGAGILVAGLALAFGKTGAAVGLVVSGIIMLVTAIKDMIENGFTSENVLLALAGIISTGLGIALLTGNFSSLLGFIGLVASGIALLVLAFQDAETNGWNLTNSLEALAGIILTGLGISVLVGSAIPALIAGILGILFAITTMTGNGGALIDSLKQTFNGLIQFITGVFTGDWNRAWEGIQNTFKGIWNTIVTSLGSAVNLIIKGINFLISKLNSISLTVPDWLPGIGGKSWRPNIKPVESWNIPRLATGAVVPPNREFMAMLGDNKTETEVVSPLSTIEQALENVMSRNGGTGGGTITVNLVVDGKTLARVVVPAINDMSTRAGRSVLKI